MEDILGFQPRLTNSMTGRVLQVVEDTLSEARQSELTSS